MSDFEHPDSIDRHSDYKNKLAVVLGLGEIGGPIFHMISDAYGDDQVYDKDIEPANWSHRKFHFKYMHVCIPQSPAFLPALKEYVAEYQPEYIIIHSTLSPGMTSYLDSVFIAPVFYSPVRGNINDGMRWSLERYTKYVAAFGYAEHEYRPVVDHLKKAKFKRSVRAKSIK